VRRSLSSGKYREEKFMRKLTAAMLTFFGLLLAAGLPTRAQPEAWPEHPTLPWSVKLSPDGHHIDLVRAGKTWVRGLTVSMGEGAKRLNSSDPEANSNA
jgi:hypothetical protein